MSEQKLLTGNEAVARGAWEAGLVFASAYPGTPSTEILESLAEYKDDLYCEWAPNEKVAMEAAIGASIAGVRSLAAMKHVGVNVAADPLFTFSYTGVTGGMLLVSADDPGLHSSQNEQDNRNYAGAARILMLEPSDSEEAKEFVKIGFELSERFDTPVLLRMTTRVCHSKSIVTLGERRPVAAVTYEKDIAKYVMTPANARVKRQKLIGRLKDELSYANDEAVSAGVNMVIPADPAAALPAVPVGAKEGGRIGVVTSGIAFQYASDAFGPAASYLKLGLTWPVPIGLIREFAATVDHLYVVEELDPYLETAMNAAGIEATGKELIPEWDELNTDIVRRAVFGLTNDTISSDIEPVSRPPSLCAGCPHRGLFWGLTKRKNTMITGDIGCYTLGSAPPLSAMDTCFCMGGSISAGHGASKAFAQSGSDKRVVSLIGDSTFFHSGITSLMDIAYNNGDAISIILDNRITAMTGQQQNPGTGYTLMGDAAPEADIKAICIALGIGEENISVIDPNDLTQVDDALDKAYASDRASVIITRSPCVLKKLSAQDLSEFGTERRVCVIDQEKCRKCKICSKTGCPAIYTGEEITINAASCTGCEVCRQVCPFEAITFEAITTEAR
ncbi:MAG: indolepyruvate ferredoxin oxidoreductase subunit alpha [Clostridiales Family XIII bacterium]|jgi:indolepyruvate ferredoxin oxidoreductase alpha subunit|nr:indolepyruvate ferredoxin oxidoreductase subunit alpha [Clostridiales Family XIII bacterium]